MNKIDLEYLITNETRAVQILSLTLLGVTGFCCCISNGLLEVAETGLEKVLTKRYIKRMESL